MLEQELLTVFPHNPSEYLWLTYTASDGKKWYITSDKMRTEYYLYKEKKKTARKAINPCDLYKYIKE